MCTALRHGGPDDEGVFCSADGQVCLGHRRLSIIDLSSAGHQPMSNSHPEPVEGWLWISFNGEIYNYLEIKQELLALGADFRTHTDTEVILKAYEQWGEASFGRLSGMFAFALSDLRQQKTYLVRDPSGIKPLYFSDINGILTFASEVKAFKQSGSPFSEDENWKIFLLAFGHIPEPYTTLRNVRMLQKGHYLVRKHYTGASTTVAYKVFRYKPAITNEQEALEMIRQSMHTSLKRQLIADAPLGVFLSGGIDSSLLTLLANEYQGKNLNTLSVNLQETDFSEKRYQDLVTERAAGQHHEYYFRYQDFVRNFQQILSSMDQPSTDGINSWFVSKCAHENGLKAVLSGIGADELYGGYPSFRRISGIQALRKAPKKIFKLAEKSSNIKWRRAYYLSYEHPVGEYLFLRGFYSPGTISMLLDADQREVDRVLSSLPVHRELDSLHAGNRASWMEINYYMQDQLLKDTDYMSMSHGLEVRVPFLDDAVIETAMAISPELKYQKGLGKILLINAFKELLPEAIWNRNKMGFTFPFQEWMRRFDPIANPEHYRNPTARKLIERFGKDQLHWSAAYALYHLEHAA
ncbi:MAG: hypothetical protein K0S09_3173 [Sphingobacteriaceae bacterium]|nr:hypothetical protein [Sphingobacteriaceae bacterium]